MAFRKMDCEFCDEELSLSLPLWHNIAGGLKLGSIIEIRGKVPYGADVFQINLTTGQDSGGHKANRIFHISARFSGQTIIRNAELAGIWGDEEKDGYFPFASGKSFFILILVEQDQYKVAVDGRHCFEFCHRFDFASATFLNINGTVKIDEIQFFMKPGAPITPAIGTCVPPNIPPGGQTIYKPSIPFYYPISGGLMPGMNIYIQGRPSASVSRFTINLQCGSGPYPPPDVAFHFDVRHSEYIVVRNTRLDNRWGMEERQVPNFPFQPAVNFDMIIRVEHDRFVVTVNGLPLFDFRHRILPLSRVNTLHIENDIVVSSIRFQ